MNERIKSEREKKPDNPLSLHNNGAGSSLQATAATYLNNIIHACNIEASLWLWLWTNYLWSAINLYAHKRMRVLDAARRTVPSFY